MRLKYHYYDKIIYIMMIFFIFQYSVSYFIIAFIIFINTYFVIVLFNKITDINCIKLKLKLDQQQNIDATI
jgi:hypothetical protein